jgi:hypothetical protein
MAVQELHQRDWANRVAFARNLLRIVADDAAIGMSNGAHFHLSGCVSKQNFPYWSDANPRQLHSERVTVWCCVGSIEEDGHAVTVNSGRCVHMLRNFLAREINRRGINQQTTWFQQDGATAHTARASMPVVRDMFPGHVISPRCDFPWPARSPDFSVCDYFLWGYLKAKVFINRP